MYYILISTMIDFCDWEDLKYKYYNIFNSSLHLEGHVCTI